MGIQIEVETLDQLREALDAGAESVLLDNFTEARMREAVALNAGRALPVSGGVGIDQLRWIAATGVDRISIGKLTKDVRAVDFSMRVEERPRLPARLVADQLSDGGELQRQRARHRPAAERLWRAPGTTPAVNETLSMPTL